MQAETTTSKVPWYKKQKGAIFWAIIVTIAIIVLGLSVFVFKKAWQLSANEIGDFFAGFAGALSFVWIIATIFLQKEELELQREEVKRLADEAVAQSAMLLETAKASFRSNWVASLKSFGGSKSLVFENVNDEIAQSLFKSEYKKDFLYRNFHKMGLHYWGNSIEQVVVAHLSYKSDRFLGKLRIFFRKDHKESPLGRLSCDEFIVDDLSTKYSVIEILAGRNIDYSELISLVSDGRELGLESFMLNHSGIVISDTSRNCDIKVDCIVRWVVFELINSH